jgi:hypothetical protein
VNFAPIIAASIGIALYGGLIVPLRIRYRKWRDDPRRPKTAQRNWRGVYVPDLAIIRMQRLFWLAYVGFIVFGLWIGWMIMVPAGPS